MLKIDVNGNIQKLNNLNKKSKDFELMKSNIYTYAYYLNESLNNLPIKLEKDKIGEFYYTLFRTLKNNRILKNYSIKDAWNERNEFSIDNLKDLLYVLYYTQQKESKDFMKENEEEILNFLKENLKFLDYEKFENFDEENEKLLKVIKFKILHKNKKDFNNNKEQVTLLEIISKIFPYYDRYDSEIIYPKLEMYNNMMDTKKQISKRNLILTYNSNLSQLWNNSILNQYKFESEFQYLMYVLESRKKIIVYLEKLSKILEKKVKGKPLYDKNFQKIAEEVLIRIQKDIFRIGKHKIQNNTSSDNDRVEKNYFRYTQNIFNNSNKILENDYHLLSLNLKESLKEVRILQDDFRNLIKTLEVNLDSDELKKLEVKELKTLKNLSLVVSYLNENGSNFYPRKNMITNYNRNKEINILKDLKNRLKNIKEITLPKKIIEDIYYTVVPILIKVTDFKIIFEKELESKLLGFPHLVHVYLKNKDELIEGCLRIEAKESISRKPWSRHKEEYHLIDETLEEVSSENNPKANLLNFMLKAWELVYVSIFLKFDCEETSKELDDIFEKLTEVNKASASNFLDDLEEINNYEEIDDLINYYLNKLIVEEYI